MKKVNVTLAELVIDEATKLKKAATQDELTNLSLHLEDLNSGCSSGCIYGQITGNCFNKRANELIIKCAERVYNVPEGLDYDILNKSVLNGKPKEVEDRKHSYFSPIEKYIYITKNQNGKKALLEYLKDIRKTLEVKDIFKTKKVLVD
jgi:hypothetical protein